MRQRLLWLLLLAMAVGPLRAQGEPPAADDAALLTEAGRLFGEVQDLAVAMEIARQGPQQDQLLVLVSLQPDRRFELEAVQLIIDGESAAFHAYSAGEIAALSAGGAHRLLMERLPPGRHELVARWLGKARRVKEEELVRELRWHFRSGETRRVVELVLSQGEGQRAPRFALREWQ